MNRKQKFRYMRNYVKEKKIKQSEIKRGIYGSLFNLPKKVKKALKKAKNENHKKYMIITFKNFAKKGNSKEALQFLNSL